MSAPSGDARPRRPGPLLRVTLGGGVAIGPGKADLLEGVRDTGSITAAGRRMGMSYKRAWLLVDAMNHLFRVPLVTASKGGTGGGGARLTLLGREVLLRYRRMEEVAAAAVAADMAALRAELAGPAGAPAGGETRTRDAEPPSLRDARSPLPLPGGEHAPAAGAGQPSAARRRSVAATRETRVAERDEKAPADPAPRANASRPRRQAEGRTAEQRGDDPAAGTADHPVSPGEFQAGDRSELASALGGPVDISPIRGRRMIERPEE